jgi:hypothetical protein
MWERRPNTAGNQLAKVKHLKQAVFMKLTQMLVVALLGLGVSFVNAEEKIFLGDLKPMKAKVGFGSYGVITNGNCGVRDGGATGAFLVNGEPAQKGVFTHCDSEVIFAIPSGVRKFTAVGTMPNYKRASRNVGGFDVLDGSWSYEVLIDGVQVYESEPLCAYVKKEVPIEVDIPENAKHITLKTHILGQGHCDHCIWAEPYFIKQ